MGDVAMTVPVLRALVAQYPEVKVTVVSRPFFAPFFHGIQRVTFFPVDLKQRHKGLMGLIRLYRDLNMLQPDYFADFHNVLRSKVVRSLFGCSGAKVATLDKGRKAKKALTALQHKVFSPVPTMFQNHCRTLEKLGFKVDLSNPVFPSQPALLSNVGQLTPPKKGYWVGVAPFAQYQTKVYPMDLMQKVIESLLDSGECTLFLFGGGTEEIAKLNRLKENRSEVIVVAGKVKFEEELNLIQNLDIMLSMDSGNAHIAAMYGKKVITLWGATHPYAGFAPFHQPEEYCITADRTRYPLIPTSVYGNKHVNGYEEAMRTIEPQTVCDTVFKALKTEKV